MACIHQPYNLCLVLVVIHIDYSVTVINLSPYHEGNVLPLLSAPWKACLSPRICQPPTRNGLPLTFRLHPKST